MTTQPAPRVPAGVPTGGQFAASAHAEADVALNEQPDASPNAADTWLPPGAHRIVDCTDCASDPARKDNPGCAYCTRGKVTTDRYGQVPWHPGKPGTKVGYVEPRDGEWKSATMTAMATESSPDNYAVGLLADGTVRDIYLHKALPLQAAQAAARHGVNGNEMAQEAVEEMAIGIAPNHDETMAFLARISDDYLDDIARSARDYRRAHATELRAEGKTGPDLDYTVDTSTLDSAAITRAIEAAADFKGQSYSSMTYVVAREHWHGHTVVQTPSGRIASYADTAWDKPTEQPILPWSPPEGTPVAHVALDGTIRRVDLPGTSL